MGQNAQSSTKFRVVYVDDDVDDRFLFAEAMREIDDKIELHALANGQELINDMEDTSSLPAIIFLDVNMPGYNGFECLTHIRNNNEFDEVSVYLLSTSSTQKNVETATNMGANGYFLKPANYADLKTLIADCLQAVTNVEPK